MRHLSFRNYPKVFTPSSPVEITEFFVGREAELFTLTKTLERSGQHAVVFGERGIGKTSLTEIALRGKKQVIRLLCADSWSFTDFSHQLLSDLGKRPRVLEIETRRDEEVSPGFDVRIARLGATRKTARNTKERGIADVHWSASSLIHELSNHDEPTIVVLDEYDLLPKHSEFHRQLSIFLKRVSDFPRQLPFTFIIVGIATSAHDLLAGHASSGRNLEQIFLKYIPRKAMRLFLNRAKDVLSISFATDVVERLVNGSFGYPYYVHLVCEKIMDAITREEPKRRHIDNTFYRLGLRGAIETKYADQKKKYADQLNRLNASSTEYLRWLCLYHDLGIRERNQAQKLLVGDDRINGASFARASESLTRSKLPITIGAKYINVRDPMFLPFLRKFYWRDSPPNVDAHPQMLLFDP